MPPSAEETDWSGRCRDELSRYSGTLLREVAAKLVRPRANQPVEELLDKSVAMLTNPPVIDRRLRDLPDASRKLLALIGLSRQPRWKVGHLLALLSALGHDEGFTPIEGALKAGLLYPELPESQPSLNDFTQWLGNAGIVAAEVFAHPAVAIRARDEDLGLPELSVARNPSGPTRAADGLDWPLRLAAVWQQVLASPVRFTQTNTLFKKDLIRLQTDELLSGQWVGEAVHPPELGVLALVWATASGLIVETGDELTAAPFPTSWESSLAAVLTELFASLPLVEAWDPLAGYAPTTDGLSAAPTAGFLILLLLAQANTEWFEASAIADWLWTHHPSWAGAIPKEAISTRGAQWVINWLFGVAFPLQLIEASGEHVRLSPLGRHLLAGGTVPTTAPAFPQTLLVQPNAEILVYRQGLTPALIATLSRFARWKGLGPACTLELTAEQTYRGLESGLTLPMMMQALARHSSRPVPPAVADLLQRWASKREQITVFASAVLVEFASPAELDNAVNRGIVALRLTDRIGMTADGAEPALAQLRLIANRDYEAKPQRCVSVSDDGVTLTVDAAAADLLLDAEIGRFAMQLPTEPMASRRFRLTAELIRRAGESLSLADLDLWFYERTGQPLSPVGRLFLLGPQSPPPAAARLLVVRFPTVELADGAMLWPETRALIDDRIGPQAVVVAEEHLEALRSKLAQVGVTVA
jgi:hypothetical protein